MVKENYSFYITSIIVGVGDFFGLLFWGIVLLGNCKDLSFKINMCWELYGRKVRNCNILNIVFIVNFEKVYEFKFKDIFLVFRFVSWYRYGFVYFFFW